MSNYPREPLKAHLLRSLYRLSGRKPSVDAFLAHQLKYRHYLPVIEPHEAIPDFSTSEVRIHQCPLGAWSTPLTDLFVVVKAALGFKSKRVLELGSFRGDTARLLAENTDDDVRICAVDIDPQHGSSYRETPVERKIERRTGAITLDLFASDEKFDLIFVDADHKFQSALNDSQVALKVLADHGVILWHDYRHDGYFHGMCGVPEALKVLSANLPIASLSATSVAIHSRYPGFRTADIAALRSQSNTDVWHQTHMRG